MLIQPFQCLALALSRGDPAWPHAGMPGCTALRGASALAPGDGRRTDGSLPTFLSRTVSHVTLGKP